MVLRNGIYGILYPQIHNAQEDLFAQMDMETSRN